MSQRCGREIARFVAIVRLLPGEMTVTSVLASLTAFPDSSSTDDRSTISEFLLSRLRTSALTETLAFSSETSGVVTEVPHSVTCTGPVASSQTLRYIPAPGYQREEFCSGLRHTATTFRSLPWWRNGVKSKLKLE